MYILLCPLTGAVPLSRPLCTAPLHLPGGSLGSLKFPGLSADCPRQVPGCAPVNERPEGPAAPLVDKAAEQMELASMLSKMTGCMVGGSGQFARRASVEAGLAEGCLDLVAGDGGGEGVGRCTKLSEEWQLAVVYWPSKLELALSVGLMAASCSSICPF